MSANRSVSSSECDKGAVPPLSVCDVKMGDLRQKILEMVKGWPVNVTACRAAALGIKADKDAKEIVRDFLKQHSG